MDLELGYILDLNMGAILISYYITMFVFHLKIDFVLHIDEETFIKIQHLVIKLEFDIHVHKIDGCYVLKVNYFHHKYIYIVITYCKKTFTIVNMMKICESYQIFILINNGLFLRNCFINQALKCIFFLIFCLFETTKIQS
jgi:hypothetical protein